MSCEFKNFARNVLEIGVGAAGFKNWVKMEIRQQALTLLQRHRINKERLSLEGIALIVLICVADFKTSF